MDSENLEMVKIKVTKFQKAQTRTLRIRMKTKRQPIKAFRGVTIAVK